MANGKRDANVLVLFAYSSGSQTFCAGGTFCYLSKFRGTPGPECRFFWSALSFPHFPLPDALQCIT